MDFISWKDSFSVGVQSIDVQHKKLVEMINQLFNEFYKGITNDFIKEIMLELEDYSDYHFSYEEKFMKLYHYEDFDSHKKEHEKFIEKINSYKEIVSKENKSSVVDFVTFIKDWMLKHIMGADKKYMKLFQEKGLS